MDTVFNQANVDPLQQPLFLGEPLGVQRYDIIKYPVFKETDDMQQEFYWRPQEVELKKDRADFKTLTENEKFIFTANLKYQTMLDSVICRGVSTLLPYVTNTELEATLIEWQRFEKVHSQSYSYIIQNVYSSPQEMFDSIYDDEEIQARAKSAIFDYDRLMGMAESKNLTEEELRRQIYLTIMSINVLEGIRFYVSFVCSFVFGENKKMVGNAEIIKLIKRDEEVHLYNTQQLIKILRTEESEGFVEIAKECDALAGQMFDSAAEEEKRWAKYLFKDGSLIGLNENIMIQYIDWLVSTRKKAVGLPHDKGLKNPVAGWSDAWMNSDAVQNAPQENENTTYKIGASTNDVDDMDFGDLEL